jgi:hypothetical protein
MFTESIGQEFRQGSGDGLSLRLDVWASDII